MLMDCGVSATTVHPGGIKTNIARASRVSPSVNGLLVRDAQQGREEFEKFFITTADKAALVRGVVEHDYERLSAVMREAEESVDPDDVVGRVRALMHAYCRFAFVNPGHYRLMLANRRIAGEPGDRPPGPLRSVLGAVVAAFDRCERAGKRL